ncbi:hypothetical protein HNQ80_001100 [Anaerosolibacter carboniphilus]|uniref:Uncharacterized protein n=1 Tax=Anaerosolibacter carboniphilus TaxID=1417629 RepID=A0A841KP02_9FIRM|nr:hypothetical protein [Anaerosolibacter carboniphilus]MBB6215011.1 hypothetical protein [Anaerosolibacter carboniphilus]
MPKISKKRAYFIVVYAVIWILFFVVSPYIKEYINSYDKIKNRMYSDFEGFGKSLEEFDSNLSRLLVLDNYEFSGQKEFINRNRVVSFWSSSFDAASLGKTNSYPQYLFTYLDANDVINNVLKDGRLEQNEKEYLDMLYKYNQELIDEYKNVMGILYYTEWNYEKTRELQDNIVDIYNQYSSRAESLLNSSKYNLVKGYKGNFQDVDFEKVESYCKGVFSVLVKDQLLKYDNREELNADKYIFRTYKERDFTEAEPQVFGKSLIDAVDYTVEYDKKTKEVAVMAVSYSVTSQTQKYKENELDEMVNNVVNKFNTKALNYDKEVKYDDEKNIEYIRYLYIEKSNDVYDEMKKIDVVIQAHGLISSFKIVYPYDEEITLPILTKEEIQERINKEAKIEDIFMVRNLKGKIVYEIHLNYNNTLYAAVFDGNDGTLEYYGREIRNYSKYQRHF